MRGWMCVPMMTLCLLLCGCGGGSETGEPEEALRQPYQTMTGCTMEAEVTCRNGEEAAAFTLRCDYAAEGESTVEVLSPETAAGVRATVDGETMKLEYRELCLPVGNVDGIAPATCLPRLMDTLREGWLLEANREKLDGIPCVRLCLDRTGADEGDILAVIWLREEDGTPLRGEIAVEDEIILQAQFTKFEFRDIITDQADEAGSAKS